MHPRTDRNRARLLMAGALFGMALVMGGCTAASLDDLGVASSAISPRLTKELSAKGFRQDEAVLIRIFKEESELEVWKQAASGRYALFKTYPICRWSGKLGPKQKAGDRQAPEGFYHVTKGMLNPVSQYYRSFNLGYPNRLEAALGYQGDSLMVHGACSSSGCFAMTDQGVGEIYAMVEKALSSGQKRVQVQSFPFRMTQSNMSSHRDDSNLNFWRNLKEGYDAFDTTRREPIVSACGARYVFNKSFEVEGSLDPLKACPPETSIPLADMAVARQPAPEDAKEAPLHVNAYVDGGMNRDYRQLLKKYGPLKLAKKVSTTSYPISRPEAALSDPFEK